jgi:hypothetical protein
MPLWLIVQLGMLITWYLVAFLFISIKGWRIGFPLSTNLFSSLIYKRIVPIAWLVSCFVYGIGHLLINLRSSELFLPLIFLNVVPLIFIGIVAGMMIKNGVDKKNEEKMLSDKYNELYLWTKKFNFIRKDMIEVNIYISKGKPVGRAHFNNLTPSQIEEIKLNTNDLPAGIYLDLGFKDNNNSNNIH